MNSDPRVSDLLLLWEESCEQGRAVLLEELCSGCPHMLDELRRQVQALQAMNPLLQIPVTRPVEKETRVPGATPVSSGTDAENSSPHWPAIPGYEIERELGRGGMGVVYLARQLQLNRRVALKMLLPESCGSEQQRQRFRAEAEIIAGLQHPHIVQIFEVGEVDGRAFCALELIEGGNLAEALAGQPCPPRVAAQLLATLADAVQAAHEKGVLHRDLKPANVLLQRNLNHRDTETQRRQEERGEKKEQENNSSSSSPSSSLLCVSVSLWFNSYSPKLTDFGLAKQLTADQGLTQTGMVMGTPSYIAPEQVQGRNRELGPPADVYSLGAILYEALTGRPPLLGPTVLETFQLVLSHDPLPVRSLQPVVPRDLDTICLKCLSKDPGRRYATARELGDDLRRFLAGEPVRARPTTSWERAVKWARRRPATAALLALLALAIGGGIYLQRQHELRGLEQVQRQRELRTAAETTLKKVGELQQEERWAEARVLLAQACDPANGDVPQELRARLEQALADVNLVGELDDIRMKTQSMVEGKFDKAGADREYEKVFRGRKLGQHGDDPTEVAARVRVSAVKRQLIAALDDWAATTENVQRCAWLLEVARRADPDPWRDRLRDTAVLSDPEKLEALVAKMKPEQFTLQMAAALGTALKTRLALDVLVAVQRRHPADFWVNFMLGSRLIEEDKYSEAISYLRAAVALRPRAATAHSNLGVALGKWKKEDEAIECWRTAIRIDEGHIAAWTNLGLSLERQGKVDAAIECLRKAITIDPQYGYAYDLLGNALLAKGKVAESIVSLQKAIGLDPRSAIAHQDLGIALKRQGKVDEAVDCLNKAIALDPRFADAHYNLGVALYGKGKVKEATKSFRKAISLNLRNAEAHYNLGVALRDQGKLDEAVECWHKSIALDPRQAKAHNNLGAYLLGKGKVDEAIECYHKAIEFDPKIAEAHNNLGSALFTKGKVDEAIQCLRKAVELDPGDSELHANLGVALSRQGRYALARDAFTCALGLLPPRHPVRINLSKQVATCERLLKLEERLPRLLSGEQQAGSAPDCLALAVMCQQHKQMHAAAACFYARAFLLEPKLARDFNEQHRYNAACSAALAGCGKGKDAASLAYSERLAWRLRALTWLRADLAVWQKQLKNWWPGQADQARAALHHWQTDTDLAGLRDASALAKLSAEEQAACQRLWADVAGLLKGTAADNKGPRP